MNKATQYAIIILVTLTAGGAFLMLWGSNLLSACLFFLLGWTLRILEARSIQFETESNEKTKAIKNLENQLKEQQSETVRVVNRMKEQSLN